MLHYNDYNLAGDVTVPVWSSRTMD